MFKSQLVMKCWYKCNCN